MVNPIVPFAVFVVIVSSATTAAAQGQPKSPQEYCKSAKEPARCLATRALLARLKAGDKTARWTDDFSPGYVSLEESDVFVTFSNSAQAAPPDEYCRNAKEQTKCLATRVLIGQLRTKDKTARWSDDIALDHTQNVKEQKLLTDFWLVVAPPAKPPEEYCAKAKEQKKCSGDAQLARAGHSARQGGAMERRRRVPLHPQRCRSEYAFQIHVGPDSGAQAQVASEVGDFYSISTSAPRMSSMAIRNIST